MKNRLRSYTARIDKKFESQNIENVEQQSPILIRRKFTKTNEKDKVL